MARWWRLADAGSVGTADGLCKTFLTSCLECFTFLDVNDL